MRFGRQMVGADIDYPVRTAGFAKKRKKSQEMKRKKSHPKRRRRRLQKKSLN